MPGQTSEDLLALYDSAPLNARYWWTFILMSAVFVFDFFDFLVVGYLLAAVAREWHLTYGKSAIILYSGGVGAIIGALVFGAFADAWGRKQQMVIGTFICAVSSGLIAFIPEGAWWLFAILRFFVGVGLTAAVTPSLTVVVELTPTRHRTTATSFYVVFASAGGFLAPAISAAIMGPYGWRRVALLGFVAAIIGVLVWLFTPNRSVGSPPRAGLPKRAPGSPSSSACRCNGCRCRRHLPDRSARQSARPALPAANVLGDDPDLGRLVDRGLWRLLWGPTIVALLLKVPVPQAAKYFVFVAGAGVAGKIIVTFVAPRIGRRLLGVLWGFGGVIALAAAGYYNGVLVSGLPLLVILLCCSISASRAAFRTSPPIRSKATA